MGYKIADGNLVFEKDNGFQDIVGVWLPENEEQILRLFARVHSRGRAEKLQEVKVALGMRGQ